MKNNNRFVMIDCKSAEVKLFVGGTCVRENQFNDVLSESEVELYRTDANALLHGIAHAPEVA